MVYGNNSLLKKRLGNNVSEAFAHKIIENNYFAWLYDYKNKNPGCTLLTEYDLVEEENEDSNDDDDKQIFCSDLDEIEIALPNNNGCDYELVFNEGPTDKICMMMTRLTCNRAIESSYWRMDNNSDVGLLMGYVLYRLPVELEFMDLDTFSH
jgi:hypothetical protein